MKKTFQIFTLLLAMLIFLSPVLSFASGLIAVNHQAEVEMNCCATLDSENAEPNCCHSDEPLVDKNNCGDKSCPTNDCHFHQVNVFHIYIPEIHTVNDSKFHFQEKLKSDNYASLLIKDVGFSFWNPPKYIS